MKKTILLVMSISMLIMPFSYERKSFASFYENVVPSAPSADYQNFMPISYPVEKPESTLAFVAEKPTSYPAEKPESTLAFVAEQPTSYPAEKPESTLAFVAEQPTSYPAEKPESTLAFVAEQPISYPVAPIISYPAEPSYTVPKNRSLLTSVKNKVDGMKSKVNNFALKLKRKAIKAGKVSSLVGVGFVSGIIYDRLFWSN